MRQNAPDGHGRFPAGAELHQPCQLLAPSGIARRFHVRRLLPHHRPRAGGRQVPPRLLRRPPGDAGPLRQRPSPHGRARHTLREDGPDHRAHRDGHGDRASRPRRHLLHHLFRTVPCRARVRHARPDDGRPRRLERRHVDERRRSAEHGLRRAPGARHALRSRRRVHGGGARPLELLGRRRDRHRQADRPVRASRQGAAAGPSGHMVPLARPVHRAAFAAGSSGGDPGRAERPRQAVLGALGRAGLRLHAHQHGARPAALSRDEGRRRAPGTRSRTSSSSRRRPMWCAPRPRRRPRTRWR